MHIRHLMLMVVTLLLISSPSLVWAASSSKADTPGFCCANNTLKESTETQCRKYKGKFYTVKESAKAQKECRAQRSTASPRTAIIPVKGEAPGFCCAKGVVKQATQGQCSKIQGSYYKSSAQAKQACKPVKIFCCVDGMISSTSDSDCKKRKGTIYKSVAEAKRKCKPADVYCCVDGKIKKSSPQQCKQHKGTAYATASEAKRKCKPADVYCCVDGKVKKSSPQQCKQHKGTVYTTVSEAKRKCKVADVYACVDGSVRKIMSPKQSKSQKVTGYKTRSEADRACRKEKISKNKQLSQSMIAAGTARPGDVKGNVVKSKVGKTPGRNVASVALATGYCCVDSKVSPWSQKECQKRKGVFFQSRISAEKACRAQKAGTSGHTEKSGAGSSFRPALAAVAAGQMGQVNASGVVNTQVGDIARLDDADNHVLPENLQVETCRVTGWVAINGLAPTVPVAMQLTPEGRAPQSFRLSMDGTFSIAVVEGSYRLQPLFSSTSGEQEQMTIEANQFVCQLDWATEFSSTFSWPDSSAGNTTPPPMCVLTGTVNFETGTESSEILGVTVSSAANGMSKAAVYDSATASYRVEIPAGSSYTVKADVEGGRRLSSGATNFTIGAEQVEHRVDFTVEKGEFSCVVGGTVLVDGQAPTEAMQLHVRPAAGNNWEQMGEIMDLSSSGLFLFSTPPGNYLVQPLFTAGSVYSETIPATQFLCDENWSEQMEMDFNYTSPPICVVSGKVTNNGHWDSRIETLTLKSYGEDSAARETRTIDVTSSGFRFEVPSGVPYTLIPDVPEGFMQADMQFFTIAPAQRSHTVNFDLNNTEFQFSRLKVIGFEEDRSQNTGWATGPIKFSIDTKTVGGGGAAHNRSVRITSPENPRIHVTQDCSFSENGTCTFYLPMDVLNMETDSIRAEMVDYADDPNSGRTWRTPFRGVSGDLVVVGHNTFKEENESTTVRIFVENHGSGISQPCEILVKLNNSYDRVFPVKALQGGHKDIIKYTARGKSPRKGDVLSVQISNSCDPLTHNNSFSVVCGDPWDLSRGPVDTIIRGVESLF